MSSPEPFEATLAAVSGEGMPGEVGTKWVCPCTQVLTTCACGQEPTDDTEAHVVDVRIEPIDDPVPHLQCV